MLCFASRSIPSRPVVGAGMQIPARLSSVGQPWERAGAVPTSRGPLKVLPDPNRYKITVKILPWPVSGRRLKQRSEGLIPVLGEGGLLFRRVGPNSAVGEPLGSILEDRHIPAKDERRTAPHTAISAFPHGNFAKPLKQISVCCWCAVLLCLPFGREWCWSVNNNNNLPYRLRST